MSLIEEMTKSGVWLFRWRSYLPLALLAVLFASLEYYACPGEAIWEWSSLLVSALGCGVRILVAGYAPKGTSGRNTRQQVALTLNTQGPYALVRHPLYLGNFIIGLGVSLLLHIWWLPLIYLLAFALYYERIMLAEEMHLRDTFGDLFTAWANRTPAFFPKRWVWRRPALPFSIKTAIKRESSTVATMVWVMFCLKMLVNFCCAYAHAYVFVWDRMWTALLVVSLVFYLIVRWLRKRTSLLKVEGR